MTTASYSGEEPKDPPRAGRFEALLAAEHEQFDPAGELLASVAEYMNAPSGTASAPTTGGPTASYSSNEEALGAEYRRGFEAGEKNALLLVAHAEAAIRRVRDVARHWEELGPEAAMEFLAAAEALAAALDGGA